MAWRNIKSFCVDNSNTIFSVLGIIFTIATVAETARATVAVRKELENAEYDNWEAMGCPEEPGVDISLTKKEVVKLAAPKYIGTAVLLTGAITFDILAYKSGEKKIAKYAAAGLAATEALRTLNDSIREYLPKKDVQNIQSDTIRRAIEADRKDAAIDAKIKALQAVGPTTTVYRDGYSPAGCGIYLKGDMDQFRRAVNLYNKLLTKYNIATLNDWYDCLVRCGVDIGHSDLGDVLEFTWADDGPMELYAVPAPFDPDLDANVIVEIALRRCDSSMNDKALPTTPRDAFGYRRGV